MPSAPRPLLRTALVGAAAYVTLNLYSLAALAQTPADSAPQSAAAPGRVGGRFSADPRAQVRTYHLDGAGIDVPYCVFASSKVSSSHPAPLIVSLHGLGAGPQIMCNSTAVDLAEKGGYILVAPMGYSIAGWYGSPVINIRGRGPRGPGPDAASIAAPAGPSNQEIQKWSEADVIFFWPSWRASERFARGIGSSSVIPRSRDPALQSAGGSQRDRQRAGIASGRGTPVASTRRSSAGQRDTLPLTVKHPKDRRSLRQDFAKRLHARAGSSVYSKMAVLDATGGGFDPPVSSFAHQAAWALAAQSCRQWHPPN